MSRRVFLPLTFEKGLRGDREASVLGAGHAKTLENWVPEPTGGLRARRGWISSSTGGAPTTRRVRGIGTVATQETLATPAERQRAESQTSTAVAWPAATTDGSLLVAFLLFGGGTAVTVTPPAGWSLGIRQDNGTDVGGAIYYKEGATSESGTVTFTLSGHNPFEDAMILSEWTGVTASSPLDRTASASGTSTSPASGATAAVTQNEEVFLGLLVADGNRSFSAPTNSFSIIETTQAYNGIFPPTYLTSAAYLAKTVTAGGTANAGATLNSSAVWAAMVATFKAKTQGITGGFHVVAHNDTEAGPDEHEIYAIDRENLFAAAWALVEAFAPTGTGADTYNPVAFASGLGQILHSAIGYPSNQLRRWDSATAATVASSPAGRCLAFHKERFWTGGTVAAPTELRYSGLADYTSWPSANTIEVGTDDGEAIEDIAPALGGLLIAKKSGLWFLSGDGPESFSLDRIDAGGGAPGRCIRPTPFGAVVAEERQVWLWQGGSGAQEISQPIEDTYQISGRFVDTAYADGVVYITDEGTGRTWAYDMVREVWWVEKVSSAGESPACLFSFAGKLLMGPKAATTGSLLSYRSEPGGTRGRDAGLSETFIAETPDEWIGGRSAPATPLHLHLQIRQRGGDASETGLTITPTYDGTAKTARTVAPKDGGAQVFRTRQDVGEAGVAAFRASFAVTQTVSASQSSLMEIEAAELEVDVEEPR
jgi:hypothetical protein